MKFSEKDILKIPYMIEQQSSNVYRIDQDTREYICEKCGKRFRNYSGVIGHQKKHRHEKAAKAASGVALEDAKVGLGDDANVAPPGGGEIDMDTLEKQIDLIQRLYQMEKKLEELKMQMLQIQAVNERCGTGFSPKSFVAGIFTFGVIFVGICIAKKSDIGKKVIEKVVDRGATKVTDFTVNKIMGK